MKRRILSIITALALCLSLCPTWAFAAEDGPDTGLCPHHQEHIDCGYIAPTEGQPCGHEHTAGCYALGVLPDADGSEYYEIGPDTQNMLDCQHSHDESCGYVQADPGQPCGFICPLCPIEDLIAALPDEVTADNAEDVRARLDEILALYTELDEAEQGQIDLSRCMELQEALDAANAPVPAEGEVSADYQEASWSNSAVTYTNQTANCTPVESDTTAWTAGGWYVVNSTVTISEPITVEGNVSLILADGCTLNAKQGIVVPTNCDLTIYAQAGGTGTLNATGVFENNAASAGIGGSAVSPDSGAVTIHGGRIHATGGGKSRFYGAAGIGGGVPVFDNGQNGGDSGAVTIFGGTVTADSGEGSNTGAGIGGGAGRASDGQREGGDGNNITIYGGTVTATSHGGVGGAGIGGGGNGGDANGGDGRNIQIHGGTVTATGGYMGAGIGGGAGSGVNKASGGGSNITISGGVVTAVGGKYAAGIGGGGGFSDQPGGTGTGIEITGGIVDATGGAGNSSGNYAGNPIGNGGNVEGTAGVDKTKGIIFENGEGRVYGTVVFAGRYDVPANYKLTIPSGASLSGTGTLTGGGEFWIEDITEDMISVPEGWHYTSDDMAAEIEAAVSLNGDVEICGKTFQAKTEGWELSVTRVSALEYTVTYAHDGKTPVTKTVTLAPATTTLSGVAAYKADGTTQATTFGVNETIVVKAKPEIGPNAAVAAANLTEPIAKQMALYVNNTLVSTPADVAQDGSYTMTVRAADVLALGQVAPGNIELTAKFVGNESQSGVEEKVEVTITAVARVENGTTTYVSSLEDAFDGINTGATVTLLTNVTLTETLSIQSGTFTLDLNGCGISIEIGPVIDLQSGKLTIQGDGSITAKGYQGIVVKTGAELAVTGGKIQGPTAGIYGNGGTVTISGDKTVLQGFPALEVGSGTTTNIFGGTFAGGLLVSYGCVANVSSGTFSPAPQSPNGESIIIYGAFGGQPAGKLILDTNKAFYQDGLPIKLPTPENRPIGTVTVKDCEHNNPDICEYTHTDGATTHSMTCLACGKVWDAEDCNYEYQSTGADEHTATCPKCGYVETEAHTLALSAKSEGFTLIVTAECSACNYTAEYSRGILESLGNLVYGKIGMAALGISFDLQSGVSPSYIIYRVDDDPTESMALSPDLSAGDHTLYAVMAFKDSSEKPVNLDPVSIPINVAKKPITATVTAENKTYDGNTGATVKAEVNSSDLVDNDSITITGVTGTFADENAGTGKTININSSAASVSGTGAENYAVSYPATVTADITKANVTITWSSPTQSVTYTGSEAAITAPTVSAENNLSVSVTPEYSYAEKDSTNFKSGLPTNAGTYTVRASITESNNLSAASADMELTINKAAYIGTTTVSTSGKYGMTKTYELKDLLPEGYVLGEITTSDSGGIFEDVPSVDGTTLTYKLVDDQNKVNEIGEITIPVTSSTNYNAFSLTVKVTVTNVLIPTLTVNPIHMTYTGSPVPNDRISGTAIVEGTAITGEWSFVSGQNITNVADSGTKQVTFQPHNTQLYGSNTGTVIVTITKATPSMTLTPSSATMPNGGTVTLTLSGLPAGGSATVTCSNGSISVAKGSGNTWTAELPAGGGSYTFTASYAGDGNHTSATDTCTVSVEKIKPTLALSASPTSLVGSGTVTLTLTGLPTGGKATVSCSDSSITMTVGAGNTWTATLPNSTATYTFTASYDGSASYHPASASCTVETKKITPLPDPPAGENGEEFQLVMEEGISEVPDGLKGVPGLETVEKLETVMKTAITQANTGIPQANTAVYDVTLMISKDGGTTWEKATAANFPASGNLTVTLPYPAGTDSSYQFTVVHMFTTNDFGNTPGETETPKVSNTPKGIQFVVTGLSPISVGWIKASTPTNPTGPTGGGGGSYVSTYAVTVEKSEHGKVTSNRNNAASGSTVTLTVTPDSGYVLDTLTVTDSRGNTLKLTDKSNGKYTFTMPSRAVTVKATFAPLPDDTERPCDGGADCPSRGFTDLGTVGTWYHEAVDYVLRNGLMGGYSSIMFGPNDNLTRAQFAQILFNKEGRPGVNYLLQYSDVAAGAWYTEAIRWATSQGVVGGYGDGRFGPNDNITREQLAVMLWRYAGSPAATDKELHFTDADKASAYALEALRWAVENGIINGYGDGRLGPDGLATRAQVAQMLKNFLNNQ